MYTYEQLEDIYQSVLAGELDCEYPELAPYKHVLEGVTNRIALFNHLPRTKNHDPYKESCKYLSKLIDICKNMDQDKVGMIDRSLLNDLGYHKAPYDKTSLYYLNSIVNPLGMAKENYQIYLKCFQLYFSYNLDRVRFDDDGLIPDFDIFRFFVKEIYYLYGGNNNLKKYPTFYNYFISYCYANRLNDEQIEYIMRKVDANFDYYYDLIEMNVGNRISNKVYYYIESIIRDINCIKKTIK